LVKRNNNQTTISSKRNLTQLCIWLLFNCSVKI